MSLMLPIVFIILMWWFSTGAVLWFARLCDGESRLPLLTMIAVGFGGLLGVYHSSQPINQAVAGADASNAATYVAVLSALAVWALIEFTFLTGALTGSRKAPCPSDISERERFWLAFRSIDYHEYALVASLIGIGLISLPGGEMMAFATFGLLWVMRISAKLTLFSGAPKFALDMMPPKLAYLQSYFRQDRVGPVFWLSTLLFTAGFIVAVAGLVLGGVPLEYKAAAIMLTTLLGLGVLEHWFMVLPIADSALWRWAMPTTDPQTLKKNSRINQNSDQRSLLVAPGYSTTRQNRRGAPS